jgi:RluA family pseudouridine synthase
VLGSNRDEDRPQSMELRSRIPAWGDGMPLVAFLAQRFPYLTADGWQEEIRQGRISLRKAPPTPTSRVRRGDDLTWLRTTSEPEVDRDVTIVHQEADFVVVDKPAHLPCHADGPFQRNTLVYLLREQLGPVQLVHRLDRETSGLMVAARTERARAALDQQFRQGLVQKHYLAIVRGRVPANFVAEQSIGRDPASAIALRRAAVEMGSTDAQPARTEFEVLDRGQDRTLLRCIPKTGRTHQIRVHLMAHGFPILGDKLYGRSDEDYLRFVQHVKQGGSARWSPDGGPDRQLLHAASLSFAHPVTESIVRYERDMPTTMKLFCPPIS